MIMRSLGLYMANTNRLKTRALRLGSTDKKHKVPAMMPAPSYRGKFWSAWRWRRRRTARCGTRVASHDFTKAAIRSLHQFHFQIRQNATDAHVQQTAIVVALQVPPTLSPRSSCRSTRRTAVSSGRPGGCQKGCSSSRPWAHRRCRRAPALLHGPLKGGGGGR